MISACVECVERNKDNKELHELGVVLFDGTFYTCSLCGCKTVSGSQQVPFMFTRFESCKKNSTEIGNK